MCTCVSLYPPTLSRSRADWTYLASMAKGFYYYERENERMDLATEVDTSFLFERTRRKRLKSLLEKVTQDREGARDKKLSSEQDTLGS